ncbi:MAG TPA: hypothetical protein PK255_03595 [Candidatus Pacearchaeota archaeon]|nr:hypothetical protein [Candidatus Pacearchaeota archaeon]HQI57583.1 hypothetical protein [Candidatus Pacearchaeota archaeon]HQJ58142.1 hypothetical protein [Candidatus Pacearchaeota archaeon]
MKVKDSSNKLKIIEKERKFTNKCRVENNNFKSKLDSFKLESKRIESNTTHKPTLKRLGKINKEINAMELSLNRNNNLILNNDKAFSREIKKLR